MGHGQQHERNRSPRKRNHEVESELRFQARHRAPHETYSPYTDEDFGSNARVNIADDYLARPQFLPGSSYGAYSGVGPKGYVRSDERICEEVCEMLTRHSSIDASNIECMVKDGELTLSGSVPERRMRYLAEEAAEHSHGVKEIYNLLKVQNPLKYSPESE